ncbi:ASST-domain-containing protein [Ilyonectria robusta]|uniref:ASST-domain-containing protein n=1 Tax=Ilyonectria robusta TaxID=1079257 RepID=UPI001E8E8710|nr:ASST-domain-containing protein [Ilyonectria robusta]KAH8664773.1 ASST-domain-containing protein [Ilyonectria robusta]
MICTGSARALAGIIASLSSLPSSVIADVPLYTDLQSYQDGALGNKPLQTFHSAPLIVAPIYQVSALEHYDGDDSEYLFMTASYAGRFGPSIVSAKDLSLIWGDENYLFSQAAEASWFKNQWVMSVYADRGVRIINQHYQLLYFVLPQGDLATLSADSHEAYLTADDTVLLIVCPEINVNLTSFGGHESDPVLNCHVQEIEPVGNKVLFQFGTLEFFDVSDTYWKYKGKGVYDLSTPAFDFCHMNSIEKTPEGDFLISYRHLRAIILVDGRTREVKWVMGGKRNQFNGISQGNKSATFYWQHQPRMTGKNRMLLFDNAGLNNGYCPNRTCSRGLELEFDPVKKTVWVVNEYYHPQDIMSSSRGGAQRLANGNTLIAWGQNAMFTEHTPEGEIVLDFQRGRVGHHDHGSPPLIAYRAFKGPWEGKPTWGPNISATVEVEGGPKKIFVSWNGATDVDKWVLLQSDDVSKLTGSGTIVAQSARLGFETPFDIPLKTTFARVAAIDINGKIIGSTPAVEIHTGTLLMLDYDITDLKIEEADSELTEPAEPTEVADAVIMTHTPAPAPAPTAAPSPSLNNGSQWVNDTGSPLTFFYFGAGVIFVLAL